MAQRDLCCPGFRFHPTDEEIICFYLKRQLIGRKDKLGHIAVIDIYKFEPWDLPSMSTLKTRDLEWYFFTLLDRKYGNGSRTNRATEKGYWKTTGKDRTIKNFDRTCGMKKTLVYHLGRAPHGDRTNWVMHEYKMVDEELAHFGIVQVDPYVLCRIFQKSGAGPKNGEKYGAPFRESDWEDVEENPSRAADKEVLIEVSASAVDADDYVDALDFEQKIDTGVTIESTDLPSNFYYGESSSHPDVSQALINNQKLLEGTFGISCPQNDHHYNMAEQYGVDTNSVQDGDASEPSLNASSLNFNYPLGDLELYFDTSSHPVSFDDFLEAKDLLNLVEGNSTMMEPSVLDEGNSTVMDPYVRDEGNSTVIDPSTLDEGNSTVIDPSTLDEGNPTLVDPYIDEMINEYLTCPDEDISKYISFDSPQNTWSGNPIASHGQTSIEQNVEGGTNGSSSANKNDFEAESSNEASSKQNPEVPTLVSGDTRSFVKKANTMLGDIPAGPAYASEFPTKKFALALQAPDAAHITAGMISITDITFRGNAMDWMVGKNGGFNTIMSSGFSQPDANSANLVPISGLVGSKTAFVLSHGWIFLMGFSVLILSMSFKIGSFMYTGK